MAVGNPFGLPLFNRLGIGAPNAAPPRVPFQGEQFYTSGPEVSLTQLNQMTGQSQGTMARVPGPDPFQGRPVPRPTPGRNPLQTMAVPPGLGPSVVITGNERLQEARQPDRFERYAAMTPEQRLESAQFELVNDRAKSPEELAMYDSIFKGTFDPAVRPMSGVEPGVGMFPLPPSLTGAPRPPGGAFSLDANPNRPGNSVQPGGVNLVGSSNNLAVTGVGMSPLPPGVDYSRPARINNPLNPNRPGSNLGGGLSNMAFPSLAPSSTNTFTGGLFGAFNNAMNNNPMSNNPMSNNSMNGGGMGGNQPLSQQIPQAVQQAVTPLLQNTATQLNQGIGSMVNQRLVGS